MSDAVSKKNRIFLSPSAWPIAVKLSAALVFAALVPLLIGSWYNLRQGIELTAKSESAGLEQLAQSTADRLDQLIRNTRHTISYFGWSKETIQLASEPDNEALRDQVEDKIRRLQESNDDLELFMVLDKNGVVLASNKPQYRYRLLNFRDYFKEAIRGRNYVSDLEVGTASNNPGMYFSVPIRGTDGSVTGVAVLKLSGSAPLGILNSLNSRKKHLEAFLIDADGIILHHPDRRLLYHSLEPLPAELQHRLIEEKRFGVDVTEIASLDMKELADALTASDRTGHVRYRSPASQVMEIAGFARLAEKGWRVAVSEHEEIYARPLERLFRNAMISIILIGIVFVGLAVLFARTFTRPLNALTRSALQIESGNLEQARVAVTTRDELGRFMQTFNQMIDGIQARQRERDIFGRVVSPEVREKLLNGELRLGGESLRVSVLFSDIRGFSTMSERMSPHDVVELLNEYLTAMAEAVRPYGGYINNFIGDAIVVVFGAPEAQSGNELNAIRAALAMKAKLAELNARRKHLGDPPLVTGIGISTGKVVAGQIGSLERFMYTVIGDAVNVAARLESLTKDFEGNPILMNAATFAGCTGNHGIHIVDRGLQRVKGRDEPVHVYAVYEQDNVLYLPQANIKEARSA